MAANPLHGNSLFFHQYWQIVGRDSALCWKNSRGVASSWRNPPTMKTSVVFADSDVWPTNPRSSSLINWRLEWKKYSSVILTKMSYWWFEIVIDQKIFWQNFRRFRPFPVGVTQRSSGGKNFKMLQMTFHVNQITCEVVRITKIYSLLCVECMVREILTKGHLKVKWGQIFNNVQFA